MPDEHLDGVANDEGDEEHMLVATVMSDEIKEEEEMSWEVPEELEGIVAEIVTEMDDSPRETDTVST